jgi:hypothetical protein
MQIVNFDVPLDGFNNEHLGAFLLELSDITAAFQKQDGTFQRRVLSDKEFQERIHCSYEDFYESLANGNVRKSFENVLMQLDDTCLYYAGSTVHPENRLLTFSAHQILKHLNDKTLNAQLGNDVIIHSFFQMQKCFLKY